MLLAGEHLSASEAKPKLPFAQRQVTLGFKEYVQLEAGKNYWHAQLTDGFKRMLGLLASVIQKFEAKQQGETVFYNDETYWKAYGFTESKRNAHWYLWLFCGLNCGAGCNSGSARLPTCTIATTHYFCTEMKEANKCPKLSDKTLGSVIFITI